MNQADRRVIDALRMSGEPSVRWKTRVNVLGETPASRACQQLQREIKQSPRVRALLSRHNRAGCIVSRRGVYDKWQGAHWVLSALADIGYPSGDRSLEPAASDVLDCWLDDYYFHEFEPRTPAQIYLKKGVPVLAGRFRRCASQQGNALWSLLTLGLGGKRVDQLAERLIYWQWPDGGWNCDKAPEAHVSSFHETLLPLRGLALHAKFRKNKVSSQAARRAAEVFLKRYLHKRLTNGTIINPEFLLLHYPAYWHYDILAGLKVMAEAGFIKDPRCGDALDLLESKRLPGGGWPAEARYCRVSRALANGTDYADWGPTGTKRMNEWVTVDALSVLRAAGRGR
jgi:hypothetical protein